MEYLEHLHYDGRMREEGLNMEVAGFFSRNFSEIPRQSVDLNPWEKEPDFTRMFEALRVRVEPDSGPFAHLPQLKKRRRRRRKAAAPIRSTPVNPTQAGPSSSMQSLNPVLGDPSVVSLNTADDSSATGTGTRYQVVALEVENKQLKKSVKGLKTRVLSMEVRIRQLEDLVIYLEKKAKKPPVIAKTLVVLDIKPMDAGTDHGQMLASVKSIEMDGLVWGAYRIVPIGYGIRKVQVSLTILDEKFSVEELTEKIEEFEDLVQSCDLISMI